MNAHRSIGVRAGRTIATVCDAFVLLLCAALSACGSSDPLSPETAAPDVPDAPASPDTTPNLLSSPLIAATPRVIALDAAPDNAARPLSASLDDWPGRPAHLAGTAHYDRGEWIYEDYPWTAYGAASPATAAVYQLLDGLGDIVDPVQRVPGGLAFFLAQAGAGPLVDEADLSELRLAVRGDRLHVMARTTSMRTPVRTALLLLFDTGRSGAAVTVPFGSGLSTRAADTAALVTAGGTRVVDLLSGDQTDLPALADPAGYINLLTTSLPIASVGMPGAGQVRLVAATGLVQAGRYEFESGGSAGPLAKVVPRFDVPVQSTYDRRQALALAAHDVDRFFVTVSLDRMRAGDSERLLPGIGYSVRTYLAPEARSSEGGSDGILRQYGLYVPQGYADDPVPATLLLRGSSMTAHGLAAITPGLFQNLGDDNGAIIISPCGRSPFDLFQGPVYLDTLQALDDAEALLAIDRDRVTVAGYSMGGYATYMFAATRPERFAGAFVIEGPVGGNRPATALLIMPDVVPSLANLLHTPIEIFQGDIDANVPIIHALAAVRRLRSLGFRYRFNLLLANTHFSPGLQNDYSIGARYLKGLRRVSEPARVLYSRSMPYEHAVDTASNTDLPAAGTSVGLSFDDAWFVHDLQAVDPVNGTATVDVRTLSRADGAVTPVVTTGIDTGPLTGQAVSPFEEQSWQIEPTADAPRNAFDANLAGVAHLRLDLAGMALSASEPLTADVHTDSPVVMVLTLSGSDCVALPGDLPGTIMPGAVTLTLAPGDHAIRLDPCG
ncbi:MAG TPA: prolyl oligopeptidase family serine peptidase [Solimonas sp.]|nr:prolyl oligopeptidase family serine peptidase [Solimonas sp.]